MPILLSAAPAPRDWAVVALCAEWCGTCRDYHYRHVHTPEELAAFDRTRATLAQIRGDIDPDVRWCAGGCGKLIRRERRSCGRRWCDGVRPSWVSFRAVIHGASRILESPRLATVMRSDLFPAPLTR